MSDHLERIAVLEANQKRLQEDIKNVLTVFETHMKNEDTRWEEVSGYMSKQKGTIGGIVLTVSAIWAVITTALFFWK